MADENHRDDPHATPDGMEGLLKAHFRDRRARTPIPDFGGMLLQVEARARSGAAWAVRPDFLPGIVGQLRHRLGVSGVLAGMCALGLVWLAGWLVGPAVTAPEVDPMLLAQLEQTTLWIAPSDRWFEPIPAPIPGGLPDFSKMQFHMTETLTWSDLNG